MAVFVTGGTGFLGRAIVRTLLSQGKEVRILVRPQSDTRALDGEDLVTVLGDVRDASGLRAAMADCDTVIHAAALVDPEAKRGELEATNVQGLRNVVEAARHHRVKKIIHVSTFLALGPTRGDVADESHVGGVRTGASAYEASKAAADKLTRLFISENAPLVVVLPTLLYGPGPIRGGNLLSALIVDLARGRLARTPLGGEERLSLAYVDDVAHGVTRALDRSKPGDRLILGGENLSFAEVLQVLQDTNSLLTLGSAGWLSLLLRGRCSPATRLALFLFEDDWAFSSSRAEKAISYRSRPFKEGAAATVTYLARNGLLTKLS